MSALTPEELRRLREYDEWLKPMLTAWDGLRAFAIVVACLASAVGMLYLVVWMFLAGLRMLR